MSKYLITYLVTASEAIGRFQEDFHGVTWAENPEAYEWNQSLTKIREIMDNVATRMAKAAKEKA
tara:strand:+ start:434 stop:625 length:192 start_codon:yes stop_codon:yes gene_type:complete